MILYIIKANKLFFSRTIFKLELVVKKALIILGCAFVCACGQPTNMPTYNRHKGTDIEKNTLMLTQVAPEDHLVLLDSFMSRLNISDPAADIAYGDNIQKEEISRLTQALTERGIKRQKISQRRVNRGNILGIVFMSESFMQDNLNQFWFSSNLVSPDFGTATNYNLTVQAARAEDLEKARELATPNPMGVIGPVERYQGGQVREVTKGDFQPGGGSGRGGGGAAN